MLHRALESADDLVVTSFYADSPGEESQYNQVHGLPSSCAGFHRVYYRCIMALMASSVQCNPRARHLVVCNVEHLPTVDGIDCNEFLAHLGVEVVTLPLTFAAPPGYSASWRACFYLLDVLLYLARVLAPDDAALVMDCDCVCVRNLDEAFAESRSAGSLFYLADYPPDTEINGLSRMARRAIFEEAAGYQTCEVPVHVGGEFLGLSGRSAAAVASACRDIWIQQLRRFSEGRSVLPTEEHILSYAAWRLGLDVGGADKYCRRIWTSYGYTTSAKSDLSLAVWHLPAEKQYSLRRLWLALARNRGPLSGPMRAQRLGDLARRCGIPQRSAGKRMLDLGGS